MAPLPHSAEPDPWAKGHSAQPSPPPHVAGGGRGDTHTRRKWHCSWSCSSEKHRMPRSPIVGWVGGADSGGQRPAPHPGQGTARAFLHTPCCLGCPACSCWPQCSLLAPPPGSSPPPPAFSAHTGTRVCPHSTALTLSAVTEERNLVDGGLESPTSLSPHSWEKFGLLVWRWKGGVRTPEGDALPRATLRLSGSL